MRIDKMDRMQCDSVESIRLVQDEVQARDSRVMAYFQFT
jgi:hypothetical protein